MKEYNLIKKIIDHLINAPFGDPAVHASVVSEELDAQMNDFARYMNYDIIACVALQEGHTVYRVECGYYGGPDYLILKKGYTLEKYKNYWRSEMSDVDEMLKGAYKVNTLQDIVKPD